MSSAKPLDPVYLLWGEDRTKIETALRRLIARVEREGGMSPERFVAADTAAADIVGSCESLSFGGTRLVIVTDLDTWKAADAEPVVDYLASPNPSTCLALVGAKNPPQRLTQAVQGTGSVLHYGMPVKASRAEQRRWFVSHLLSEVKAAGGSIAERTAGEIVDRLGGVTDDTRTWLAPALTTEAVKLAAYCGREPIDPAAVAALVVAHPDAPAYELTDALARGDRAATYQTLANAADQQDSRSGAAALQWSATRHFRGVAACQEIGPAAGTGDVTRLAGISGYPAQRIVEQGTQLNPGVGARVLARLAQLELDLRVSSLLRLGRSRDDGERFAWERAAADSISARDSSTSG
jgi:DNA polymerase III subunit delta